MPQPMAICPNCFRPVYGRDRITHGEGYIEVDCPHCGPQGRDLPIIGSGGPPGREGKDEEATGAERSSA